MIATIDDWRLEAACRDADPDIFFPERGGFDYETAISLARRFCDLCPVRQDCLEFGKHETQGIWGGKTPLERRPKTRRTPGFCHVCDEPIHRRGPQGPPARYCSNTCRQTAYKMRKGI